MTVDRTPKPCLHKVARHRHGTHTAYVLDRCRCDDCRRANREYERMRSRQTAYGRWKPYVDAEPARAHVRTLMDAGIGLKRVAQLSGVPHGGLWKLVYGKPDPDGIKRPSKQIRQTTADKILAVKATPDAYSGGAKVDATGTQRRLRALVALGWSQSKLADRLGVNLSSFGRTMATSTVLASTARAVRVLYDELSMQLPPQDGHRQKISAARSRNYAKARGWKPPLAWDDDQLDAPDTRAPLRRRRRDVGEAS